MSDCGGTVGHQDSGREAGVGHWGGAAHHLHLLLPHGVQCKRLHNTCTAAAVNAARL